LVPCPGAPVALAAALRERAEELRRRSRWWQGSGTRPRLYLAGALVATEGEPAAFLAELERVRPALRAAKVRRSGIGEPLVVQILREATHDGRVADEHVRRLGALVARVKQDHPWLTGPGVFPTLALLATSTDSVEAIGTRAEEIVLDLDRRALRGTRELLPTSHILYLASQGDSGACERFASLWRRFQGAGLRMKRRDYAALALLTFVPGDDATVVARVLAGRDRIRDLRPRPSRDEAFALACATTFSAHAQGAPEIERLARMHAALHFRRLAVQQEQQAAASAS
jgi:hypothetical protein